MQPAYRASDLEWLFLEKLGRRWHTHLKGGAGEPWYEPPRKHSPAYLYYRADFFRSALHEIAHWCIAGARRRTLPDFGYWYEPDGRDGQAQAVFQRVERLPQALELLFCAACGHPFCVSLDNLEGEAGQIAGFEATVFDTACALLNEQRIPGRAALWCSALRAYYRPGSQATMEELENVFVRLSA